MRAIVTGSEGFIGAHLVARLVRDGFDVVGVDRRADGSPDSRRIDMADPAQREDLAGAVVGADVVFHLAGRPGVRDCHPGVDALRRRDNIGATRQLFSILPGEVPVIVTSSSSVYGSAADESGRVRPCREDDPFAPRGGYARSKVAMERLCSERIVSGSVVTVVRPFTVVGEHQRPDMAFSQWLTSVREGRPIRLLGSPDRIRDLTDVRDVVEGLVRAAGAGYPGVLNLGTGVGHRIADMARAVMDVVGASVGAEVCPGSSEEVTATLADTSRCREVLGFVPETDLVSVVRRMAEVSESPTGALVAAVSA